MHPPTVFFTADTHFDHANIIEHCNRPYSSLEEMNQALIDNWNSVVRPQDTVYHLGDFAFRSKRTRINHLIQKLNGHKFLIYGNHDHKQTDKSEGWVWKGHYKKIKVNDQKIILFHYAMRVWDCSHHGSWHFYGHSHGTLFDNRMTLSMDVGVDVRNFSPISFERLSEAMQHRQKKIEEWACQSKLS